MANHRNYHSALGGTFFRSDKIAKLTNGPTPCLWQFVATQSNSHAGISEETTCTQTEFIHILSASHVEHVCRHRPRMCSWLSRLCTTSDLSVDIPQHKSRWYFFRPQIGAILCGSLPSNTSQRLINHIEEVTMGMLLLDMPCRQIILIVNHMTWAYVLDAVVFPSVPITHSPHWPILFC